MEFQGAAEEEASRGGGGGGGVVVELGRITEAFFFSYLLGSVSVLTSSRRTLRPTLSA